MRRPPSEEKRTLVSIAEPMTVLTDYLLAALAVALARRLYARSEGQASRRYWAGSFLSLAVAALVGGTSHAFAPRMSAGTHAAFWAVTYVAVGLANMAILAGGLVATAPRRWHRPLLALVVVRFVVFTLLLLARREFRYVVYDYGATLFVLLVLALWSWGSRRDASAPFVIAGVLVSLAGAVVQVGRLAPHPDFNHNDLFHVVQMIGVYLFFRAALLFHDR
jgi:hypothetical protein